MTLLMNENLQKAAALIIMAKGTLPSLNLFKFEDEAKPCIGFRVIVSRGDEWYQNTLRSRHPQADATLQTLQDHLAWRKERPSPFVSLWTSWPRAVNWAKSRAKSGGLCIDIAAVWIHEQDVFDAYDAATRLPMPPDKLPEYYEGEVVIVDRGGTADFGMLAEWNFVTQRRWETVTFDLPTESLTTSLPVGLMAFATGSYWDDFEDSETTKWRTWGFLALVDEVRSRAGRGNSFKAFMLAQLLCKGELTWYPTRRDIGPAERITMRAGLGRY